MNFETWLARRGYKPSVVRLTLRHVAAAEAAFNARGLDGLSKLPYTFSACRRYLSWAQAEKRRSGFRTALGRHGLVPLALPVPGAGAGRKGDPEAYSAAERRKLVKAWRARGSREGRILLCVSADHKVGAILGMTRSAVLELPEEPLQALGKAMGPRAGQTVAEWLTGRPGASPDAGQGAWQRLNRHLRRTAVELGIEGPNHLERLRKVAP